MTLKEYLAQTKLKERELAARAGVTQSTINKLKRGALNPTLAILNRIYKATGGKVGSGDFLPSEKAESANCQEEAT